MTDRKMLELAAKAAGGKLIDSVLRSEYGERLYEFRTATSTEFWNPLKDDGDALRLAIDLGMILHFDGELLAAKKDPYAATRRDIVSIAAKIGSRQCSK
jgi:hypothetical protein